MQVGFIPVGGLDGSDGFLRQFPNGIKTLFALTQDNLIDFGRSLSERQIQVCTESDGIPYDFGKPNYPVDLWIKKRTSGPTVGRFTFRISTVGGEWNNGMDTPPPPFHGYNAGGFYIPPAGHELELGTVTATVTCVGSFGGSFTQSIPWMNHGSIDYGFGTNSDFPATPAFFIVGASAVITITTSLGSSISVAIG